jgi:hypothetical protein
MVIAPEHDLVSIITTPNKLISNAYIKEASINQISIAPTLPGKKQVYSPALCCQSG